MPGRVIPILRSQVVLIIIVVLGVMAGTAIILLERHADASRQAESQIGSIKFALADLENAPFSADPSSGGSPAFARRAITDDSRFIAQAIRDLIVSGAPPAPLRRVGPAVHRAGPAIEQIFAIGAYEGGYAGHQRLRIARLQRSLQASVTSTLGLLTQSQRQYSQRAGAASTEAVIGSVATVFALLVIFVAFYRRSTVARGAAERLSIENARLLATSQDEAVTDPLTGLGNRRAFKRDLDAILPNVTAEAELVVAIFDLDGFKQYNDTFGHGAGDALLARLGRRLKSAAGASAAAYRMGGDEFCLLAQASSADGERLVEVAVAALSETGEGWQIRCSWGMARMPSDATGTSEVLRLADERMYAGKAGRATAARQATAALVQVLIEKDIDLATHISGVAALSIATARQLGIAESEVERVGLAAQLHDIGKTAIPESILNKPGPLDHDEWDFMHRHTLIGERIIAAAPSLAHTANLVRSSHERFDGSGYPDRLAGTDIPLGSRIISVCDAYEAMIVQRVYQGARGVAEALQELRRCSGSQFDPSVVDALQMLVLHPAAAAAALESRFFAGNGGDGLTVALP